MPSSNSAIWLSDKVDLGRLNLRSWVELLGDPGVQDAMALLTAKPSEADLLRAGLDPARTQNLDAERLAGLPLKALKRLSPDLRRGLPAVLGVRTVGDLVRAVAIVRSASVLEDVSEPDPFFEPPSAPRELIPRATGSIAASARYTQFVRERPFSLADLGLELRVDASLVSSVDARLLAAFQFDPTPILHLGYMAGFRQEWINQGSFLGEPLQSIGLAPGETRRIAVVDWQRSMATRRGEDTDLAEAIDNTVTHKRSLAEVVTSTASEIQGGSTSLAAGTLATAVGTVAAGAIAGGAGGALIGAGVGAVGGGAPAVPGSLIGLAVGAVAGGIGAAATVSGNAQLGVVESDTSGERTVSSNFSQRVNDISTQKATALRSVMSTVVVTGDEAERDSLSTRAIANHNHAHALTIQYFEVLQHYRVRVRLDEHQGLLFLPMQPLVFDSELILANWDTLRFGFAGGQRARFDAMVSRSRRLTESPLLDRDFDVDSVRVVRINVNGLPLGYQLSLWSSRTTLDELSFARLRSSRSLRLELASHDPALTEIRGLHLHSPFDGLSGSFSMLASVDAQPVLEVSVVLDTAPATTLNLSVATEGQNGRVALDLDSALLRAQDEARRAAESASELEELVAAINARPYRFTRLLMLSLEPEQLREVIEALVLVSPQRVAASPSPASSSAAAVAGSTVQRRLIRSDLVNVLSQDVIHPAGRSWLDHLRAQLPAVQRNQGVPLSCLVDSQPFGWNDGMLVLALRQLRDQGSTAVDFQRVSKKLPVLEFLRDYPAELDDALRRLAERESQQSIFLPTGGHFAEAILGRSIAAERLDGTRHIFWHELPNPLVASDIAALAAGSRSQPLPSTAPTQADPVLSQVQPTPLPAPTMGDAALAVLSQQNLFRDMSKTGELVGVLNSLSGLAGTMASQAGQLAGSAQAQALQQAGALAQQVASLVEAMVQTSNAGGLPANASSTQRAVAGNRVQDLTRSPLPNLPGTAGSGAPFDANDAVARAFGAVPTPPGTRKGSQADGEPSADAPGPTAFLRDAQPFPERSDTVAIRDALPESLRATTDTGGEIRQALRDTPGDVTAVAERRLASGFAENLQPLLQTITADDETLDRAIRLALDLQATHDLVGLDGEGPLLRAAPALADGWRASRQRAIAAISSSGTLDAVPRLETLVGTAQAGLDRILDLTPAETSLEDALSQAGVELSIKRFDRPAEVAAGESVDLVVGVELKIGSRSPAPLANARVVVSALESLEGEVRATTASDGVARLRLTHDPSHLGVDSRGPLSPNGDVGVLVQVFHPDFDAIQSESLATVPGKLSLTVISAVHDDDGTNALAGTVVIPQPARPVFVQLQLLSAGVPVRRAPVTVSVNGSVSIQQFTRFSGTDDARGLVSLTLVPGAAGSGISFVAVSAEVADGRVVSSRVDVQSP